MRSNHIIIKVLDYVIWDFKGPIGRKTYLLLATRSCLVIIIIIKVFRFNGRPYCYSSVSFSLLLLFFFFLTRFLQNAWTVFHEIFRDCVYSSKKTENNFWCDDVTSGPRYWGFSNFQGVILLRDLLRNDTSYLIQILREDRKRSEVCIFWVSSL